MELADALVARVRQAFNARKEACLGGLEEPKVMRPAVGEGRAEDARPSFLSSTTCAFNVCRCFSPE